MERGSRASGLLSGEGEGVKEKKRVAVVERGERGGRGRGGGRGGGREGENRGECACVLWCLIG
jgi:hypothetical protein